MRATDIRTLLEEAAREAGSIARRHFGASPDVWEKSGGAGPVTEADLEIDRMLRSELTQAQPDFGWLSEETEDDLQRLEKEHVFIVDPIDGTRSFIAGEKSFSHSLAVTRNGQVIAAAVYVPMLDLMFSADADNAAYLNGACISVSDQAEVEGATVLAAKPNMRPEFWKGEVPPLRRKFRPSLAYRLCLVARGSFDGMMTLRECWEWDIAAGELIVRQAGGVATDQVGAPLSFNNPRPKTDGCLAAGASLHESIRSRLKRR